MDRPVHTASLPSTRPSPCGSESPRALRLESPLLPRYFAVAIAVTVTLGACASSRPQPPALAPPPAIAAAAPSPSGPNQSPAQSAQSVTLSKPEVERQFLNLINQERAQNGLKPLAISKELKLSAQAHSDAMAQGGFLSLKGGAESSLVERFERAGARSDAIGENVLSIPVADPELAEEGVKTWMAKDAARLNLLSPRFERTGIAIERSPGPVGEAYVTEDFAR
jgi:uncharacterized protein YkwD